MLRYAIMKKKSKYPCFLVQQNLTKMSRLVEFHYTRFSHKYIDYLARALSLSISARTVFNRRFLIQRLRSKDTLSMPILQLHPYNYFGVNPRSFARFTVYVSFFRKRIFVCLDWNTFSIIYSFAIQLVLAIISLF